MTRGKKDNGKVEKDKRNEAVSGGEGVRQRGEAAGLSSGEADEEFHF